MSSFSRRSFLRRSTAMGLSASALGTLARMYRPVTVRAAGPPPPTLVVAQGLSDTRIQLLWTAVPGATSYVVQRAGVQVAQQPGTLYVDAERAAQTAYTYRIIAVSSGGQSSPSAPVTATTQAPRDAAPPTQPGTITVSNVTSKGATLKWPGSSDNTKVVGYRLLRGTPGASLSALVQIGTTDALEFYTATNLRSGTAYQFAVLAVDQDGNLSPARTVTFTTARSSDKTAPAAPSSSSVTAKAFSSSRIDVKWGNASSSDISGYEVFRNDTPVATITLPLRKTYSDNGLAPDTTYTYKVRSIDSAGNVSALTSGRTAKTLAAGAVIIARGPYLQQVTATSAIVAWWTNLPTASVVDYGTSTLSQRVSDPMLTRQHVMLLGGLTAGTTYTYRVTSGNAIGDSLTFRTGDPPDAAFTFAAVGDFGGGSGAMTDNASLIAAAGTRFIQTVGDNVYPDAQDPDFATTLADFDTRFYVPYAAAIRQQAIWVANGNKEYYGDGAHFQNFWMPNNERWYSYEWGGARVVVLDTEQPYSPGTPQYQFAEAELRASQSKAWRIVVVHRPPYSSSGQSQSVLDALVPLFEQYNVQLVLSGNSHNYERTHPLRNGTPVTEGGVTYIVTGGGGNGLNSFSDPQPSWSAFRQATFQHLRIAVSPTMMRVDCISADTGAVLDSTTIAPRAASDTQAPSAPATLTAVAASATRVDLAWGASSDNVGVVGYEIYRNGALLTTVGVQTAYSDTTVTASTTYNYTVKARDAASNISPPSNTASVTTPAVPTTTTLTFSPVADAYVDNGSASTNYGTDSALKVDTSPTIRHAYLRFAVSGVTGPVGRATLRVYATDSSSNGPLVYATGSSWTETGLTWNNKPAPTGASSDNKGAVDANSWVEYDVTPLVTGDGTYSFVLVPESSDGLDMASRQATTVANRPQLVLSIGGGSG